MTLRAAGLVDTAGSRSLIEGVSLDLRPGRVLAVLGPNGAGKSTLLKLLSGERVPRAGTIEVGGRSLTEWSAPDLARVRAVVSQRDSLNFSFTAREVVALGRLPHRALKPHQHHSVIEASLRRVDAHHLADRHYPTLSGGERARVQLARAMAQIWSPIPDHDRYLLLDEPTASQDLAHQHLCLRVVRAFAREGVAVMVVLHDPNLVLDYADDVLVLCCGQRLALGAPFDVLDTALLQRIYGIPVRIAVDAESGRRWIQVPPDLPLVDE